MIYITGDTHGRFERLWHFCRRRETTKEDVLIILGDAGINYCLDALDEKVKERLQRLPITLFCIHGNHEQRPECVAGYEVRERFGGQVYVQPLYPDLLFAQDGEVYEFAGRRTIVIGGAYSVDREYRIERGFPWFANEQPSEEIKRRVEAKLDEIGWKVDLVLTHTAPLKYEPSEAFLPFIDQKQVDKSTEQWLDGIESRLQYRRWYCGHFHIQKKVDKMRFVYENYIALERMGQDQQALCL